MCGIVGFFAKDKMVVDKSAVTRMAQALAHRGPDGHGALDARGVALRHLRLSIIDLDGGAQPLKQGEVALVANGEIYNDLTLRAQMPDVTFETGSDCEVPLFLWQAHGIDFPKKLRGMFAIALVDQRSSVDRAVLTRDPFGIKPLYTVETAQGIAFASEPRALIAGGFAAPNCAPHKVKQLLQCQFVPGRDTIYADIKRVLPGEAIEIENGLVTTRRLISPVQGDTDHLLTEDAALEAFDRAFCDSVRVHQRSDVPSGLFLSGGVDSTAILAAMARLDVQKPVAWTARFDAGAVDESGVAEAVAKAFQAKHEVVTVTQSMFWQHLPEIIAALDDPVADYAVVPTWFLAQAAKQDLTVILSGEGGDELFGGYGRYRRATRPAWLGGRAPWSKGILDDVLPGLKDATWRAPFKISKARDRFRAAQKLDIETWLPDDLLIKLDRCLMAHGLEGRTPFLDPVVASFAWRLPERLKRRDGRGKYLVRRWLSTQTDAVDAFASKQGFTVPVGNWIAARCAELAPLMQNQECLKQVFPGLDAAAVMRMAGDRRARHAAWVLLFFAVWHKIHIECVACDGDVFEILACKG